MTWICNYCGRNNDGNLKRCWDGVNGCGATRPERRYCVGFGITAVEASNALGASFTDINSCGASASLDM